jgi:hypothetical protein
LEHDCSHCPGLNEVKFSRSFLSAGKYLFFKPMISGVYQSRARPRVRFFQPGFPENFMWKAISVIFWHMAMDWRVESQMFEG